MKKNRVSSRGPAIALATDKSALTDLSTATRTPPPADAAVKLPPVPNEVSIEAGASSHSRP
jgi:hypothetical protein